MRNPDDEFLSSDIFVDPKLIGEFTDRYDEYIEADLSFEDMRSARATLRRSGNYYHHAAQAIGSAFIRLGDLERRAEERLIEVQDELMRAMGHVETHLKKKCALVGLDTVRCRPLTDALTAALEGSWGFRASEQLWPIDERRELIANAGIALSVLRTIAKLERKYPAITDMIEAVTGR